MKIQSILQQLYGERFYWSKGNAVEFGLTTIFKDLNTAMEIGVRYLGYVLTPVTQYTLVYQYCEKRSMYRYIYILHHVHFRFNLVFFLPLHSQTI